MHYDFEVMAVLIWVAAAFFWVLLVMKVGRPRSRVAELAPTFFLTASIALSFDLAANIIAKWYEYQLFGLSNAWTILVLGLVGYPVVGCLYVADLPEDSLRRFVHTLWWIAILLVIEVPALKTGELIYSVWRLWWSPLLYLAVYYTLAVEFRWRKRG